MLTNNPLPQLEISDLFASPREMMYQEPTTVYRGFCVMFQALRMAKILGVTEMLPEIWTATYLLISKGFRGNAEDGQRIDAAASWIETVIPGSVSQDVLEFPMYRKINTVRPLSKDPSNFGKGVASVLRTLSGTATTPLPENLAGAWLCVREASAIFDRLTTSQPVRLIHPVSNHEMALMGEFLRQTSSDLAVAVADEYFARLWGIAIPTFFPFLGAKAKAEAFSLTDLPGEELVDRRLAAARRGRFFVPDGFDFSIVDFDAIQEPFMLDERLFGTQEMRNLRASVIPEFKAPAYRKQCRDLCELVRKPHLVHVTTSDLLEKSVAAGRLLGYWDTERTASEYSFCDSPDDAAAGSDLRLWGGLGKSVAPMVAVLPIEPDEIVNRNLGLASSLVARRGDPMVVQMDPDLIGSAATMTLGPSAQALAAVQFSRRAMVWLIEARMFCIEATMKSQGLPGIVAKLTESSPLWQSLFMMVMGSGGPAPYLEVQVHGDVSMSSVGLASRVADLFSEAPEEELPEETQSQETTDQDATSN